MPHINALYLVSIMMFQNIFSIAQIIEFSGIKIVSVTPTPRIGFFATIFSIVALNYFLFVRHRKYKILAKKYDHESPTEKRRKAVWIWVYMIMSLFSIIGLSYLHRTIGTFHAFNQSMR